MTRGKLICFWLSHKQDIYTRGQRHEVNLNTDARFWKQVSSGEYICNNQNW